MKLQNIIQAALDTENLKTVIQEESKNTPYVPVVLVTNGVMSEDIDVTMFGEKVKVVKDKEDSELIKEGHPFIYMLKCDVREKKGKAELEMVFNQAKVSIKLQEEDGKWVFKTFSRKQKGKYSYETDF